MRSDKITVDLPRAAFEALLGAAYHRAEEAANHRSDQAGPTVATLDLQDGIRAMEAAARQAGSAA